MKKSIIYTKTGDTGETGLYGGKRIKKSSIRMHAIGTVDELNAILGIILAAKTVPKTSADQLSQIQSELFTLGADLATPLSETVYVPRIEEHHVMQLEKWIDEMDGSLESLTNFILPSGSILGSHVHQARTVCRRGERWLVELADQDAINPLTIMYMNRLSDYLFVAARTINKEHGMPESKVFIKERSSNRTKN